MAKRKAANAREPGRWYFTACVTQDGEAVVSIETSPDHAVLLAVEAVYELADILTRTADAADLLAARLASLEGKST